jgi:hypothetical protein
LEIEVAKKAAKRKISRKEYTASDIKLLKMHSKARTPVSKLAKLMKRSAGSLRQKALKLGIGLGHQRQNWREICDRGDGFGTSKSDQSRHS